MAKKLILDPILANLTQIRAPFFFFFFYFFSWILPLLHVRHCRQLSLYVTSKKTNEPNLRKLQKKKSFGPTFGPFGLSGTRYHGQRSPCTTSEKTNDPILRKICDGRTDRWTNGREWFHRTLSN